MESDVKILSNIQSTLEEDPAANQRKLAQTTGMSLGMTNAVIKKFIERGWLAVKNLNMKKVCYVLTAEGMAKTAERTAAFIQRNMAFANDYGQALVSRIKAAKNSGKDTVVLVGKSQILFLLQYACETEKMTLKQTDSPVSGENAFLVVGELESPEFQLEMVEKGCESLYNIVEKVRK